MTAGFHRRALQPSVGVCPISSFAPTRAVLVGSVGYILAIDLLLACLLLLFRRLLSTMRREMLSNDVVRTNSYNLKRVYLVFIFNVRLLRRTFESAFYSASLLPFSVEFGVWS